MLHRGSKYPVVGTFIKAILLSLSSPNTDFRQLSELLVFVQNCTIGVDNVFDFS